MSSTAADRPLAPSHLLRTARWLPRAARPHPLPRHRFRSVWISDVHLGSRECRAEELLAFLRAVAAERLYLVGDVIDGWQLARETWWPGSHQRVLEELLQRARQGARVVYVIGNHDEELRRSDERDFDELICVDEVLHDCADGRRLFVLHGDRFDNVLNGMRWLADLGDRADAVSSGIEARLNRVVARLGGPELRVSDTLRDWVKTAASRVNRWEESLLEHARAQGADGVVCGHIHRAELRELGGLCYANDGDWIESCTALVEEEDGALRLVAWRAGQLHELTALPARPSLATRVAAAG